jgi:hypothetical protein
MTPKIVTGEIFPWPSLRIIFLESGPAPAQTSNNRIRLFRMSQVMVFPMFKIMMGYRGFDYNVGLGIVEFVSINMVDYFAMLKGPTDFCFSD